MKAPDKIYLHGYSFSDEPVKSWEREPKVKRGVTGFKPQYAEYIRKDALLEWAKFVLKCQEEELAKYDGPSYMRASTMGRIDAYKVVIAKLNSM